MGILVVDVRGRDWVGGHIPSSINLRTSEVVKNPESLLMQCRKNGVHHMIFTCMYSVLRARKCAVAVENAQMEEKDSGLATYRIQISLLAGGMHGWVNHLGGTPSVSGQSNPYIDTFDPECWCDGGPSQGGLVHVMDALWSSGGQKALSQALTAELESLLVVRQQRGSSTSQASSAATSRRPSDRDGQLKCASPPGDEPLQDSSFGEEEPKVLPYEKPD